MHPIGRKRWAIAEGYIPSQSSFSDPGLISHETACILNAGERDANVAITIFFADRGPVGPYRLTVSARRTLQLRFNDLEDPAPIPRDTEYASLFESDEPIIVQHTRLDSATRRSACFPPWPMRRADGLCGALKAAKAPEHDPEKWIPVSRLREGLARLVIPA
jgi:hypothetical protein